MSGIDWISRGRELKLAKERDSLPATSRWRYDVENAPEGEEVLATWNGKNSFTVWLMANGMWRGNDSRPDSLEPPLAYALITPPEPKESEG